jgi:hypothetical protein
LLPTGFPPQVEDPIPDTVGLGTIVAVAGVGGILGVVAASLVGTPRADPDAWARRGLVAGFIIGSISYLAALIATVF